MATRQSISITIDEYNLENMNNFIYLGVKLTKDGSNVNEKNEFSSERKPSTRPCRL